MSSFLGVGVGQFCEMWRQFQLLHQMNAPGPLAVMMVGIPASGKSGIAVPLSDQLGLERISSDDLIPRDDQGKRIYRRHILRRSWLQVWKKIGRCIKERRSFLVDAMLLTNERRNPVIGIANGAGFVSVGIFMNTPVEICMIRNSLRKDRVADSRLLRAAASLEPPYPDEEWTALYRIDQNRFITKWSRDHLKRMELTVISDCFEPALRKAVDMGK